MANQTTNGYDWGSKKINKNYNRNIQHIYDYGVDAPKVDLPVQTKASIQDQIRGYLNPAYDKAIKSLAKQRDYERKYMGYDPNSRAATSNDNEAASDSAWYRNAKRNLDIGETYARSGVSNNFLAQLAQGTATQYGKYLDRRAETDAFNSSMELNASKTTANLQDAAEEMIYEQAIRRARGR